MQLQVAESHQQEPGDMQEDVSSNMKNEAGRLPFSIRCQYIHYTRSIKHLTSRHIRVTQERKQTWHHTLQQLAEQLMLPLWRIMQTQSWLWSEISDSLWPQCENGGRCIKDQLSIPSLSERDASSRLDVQGWAELHKCVEDCSGMMSANNKSAGTDLPLQSASCWKSAGHYETKVQPQRPWMEIFQQAGVETNFTFRSSRIHILSSQLWTISGPSWKTFNCTQI